MEITLKKYAELRKISDQGARKAIRKGHYTPGIIAWKKLGRDYTIVVPKAFVEDPENFLIRLREKG